jgi:hypothetical protein
MSTRYASALYAYCEKCGHLARKEWLHPRQVCRQTHDSPAEYENWCERCHQVSGRERGDDDGVEYGHPGDRLAGRE